MSDSIRRNLGGAVLNRRTWRAGLAGLSAALVAWVFTGCATKSTEPVAQHETPSLRVTKWTLFERTFSSTRVYATNAFSVQVAVHFTSAGGREMVIPARYLGGQAWKVSFVPNEAGTWTWKSESSDPQNAGLNGVMGEFYCTAPNQLGNRNTPPLDDPAVRIPYMQALFNNPASDLAEVGHLISPSAEGQTTALFEVLTGTEFWRLRPCPEMIVQPAKAIELGRQIVALRTGNGDQLLAYTPGERSVSVRLQAVPKGCKARWLNPRTGAAHPAIGVVSAARIEFPTPEPGDWFLDLRAGK